MSDTPTAIVPAESPVPANDALAKVAENLSSLKPKDDPLAVVSGKTLGDVLPQKFYEGAGLLKLSEDERQMLETLQDASDDEVEIRPDGLIYVEHITVRRALSKVFGTEWACVPGSAIAQDAAQSKTLVCQRWVLLIRGCYVGEAIGAGSYFANNASQNKTDAAEAAQSEAIRRICAKSALGICSNVFQKSFGRKWMRENAVQVWVKTDSGNRKFWRRKDSDPFEGEIEIVDRKQAPKQESRSAPKPQPAVEQPHYEPEPEPPAADWSDVEPERPSPTPVARETLKVKPANPPASPDPKPPLMVTEGNWRLFMLECRKRKLVAKTSDGREDATPAISLLVKVVDMPAPTNTTGKTHVEILRGMFMTLTAKQFDNVILEAKGR